MDPETVIDELKKVLHRERAAIRTLDGAEVAACADEKSALARRLQAFGPQQRSALAPRLRLLAAELRHNGILLVHARGILADLVRLRSASTKMSPGSPHGPIRPGARLSVRG